MGRRLAFLGDSITVPNTTDRPTWTPMFVDAVQPESWESFAVGGGRYATYEESVDYIPERNFQIQLAAAFASTTAFTDYFFCFGANDAGSNVIPLGSAAALDKDYGDLDETISCDSARKGIHLTRYNKPEANIHVLLPLQCGDISGYKQEVMDAYVRDLWTIARRYSCHVIDQWGESGIVSWFEPPTGGPNLIDGRHPRLVGATRQSNLNTARTNAFWGG